MRVQRTVVLRSSGAQVRIAKFNGEDHLVAPVVMMVGDRAVWPVNAEKPEFVPLEVLSAAPWGWAGRPVCNGHPTVDGEPVSANSPNVLEANAFGQVFEPGVSSGKLGSDVWLNDARAMKVGAQAVRTMERIRNGEDVEVSVGCWVTLEDVEGVDSQGRAYSKKWVDVVPDHLALLPEGDTGACSVEMGCGVRANASGEKKSRHVHLVTAKGYDIEGETLASASEAAASTNDAKETVMAENEKRSLRQRLASLFGALVRNYAGADGTSMREIYEQLDMTLRATEPAFGYVEDVYPDTGKVVYCCFPMNERILYRRGYTVAGDAVTLVDDREQVEETRSYEPVKAAGEGGNPTTAAAKTETPTTSNPSGESAATVTHVATAAETPTPPKTACGCDGGVKQTTTAADAANKESDMNEQEKAARKAKVDALLGMKVTTFKEADTDFLMGLSEERFAEIEADTRALCERVTTAEAKANETPAVKTEAEWLQAAPASVRALVTRAQEQEQQTRNEFVRQLKASTDLSEDELKAMSMAELQRLAKVAKVEPPTVDYSALAGSNAGSERDVNSVYTNPPNGYKAALEAKQAAAR